MKNPVHGIGMTSARTRGRLVDRLRSLGIHDERVLAVIGEIPRHLFVDEALAHRAYEDTALPIGHGQTISQPFVVALMTQTLIAPGIPEKVLEIGTGCGYQSAVLSRLCGQVYTVERIEPLATAARRRLRQLGYLNIHFRVDDGGLGWPPFAPYNAILAAAAASEIPTALREQLNVGGRMVLPVGDSAQELRLIERNISGFQEESLGRVTFVPLVRDTPGP